MPIDDEHVARLHLPGGQQPSKRGDYMALDSALQMPRSITLVGSLLQQELSSFTRYSKLKGTRR
jgi:hypothetical protein